MRSHVIFRPILGLSMLLLVVCTAAADEYDWPQLGRDPQRSNYTPEPLGKEPSVSGPSGWVEVWTWRTPSSSVAIRTTPVVAEGIVAVGTHDGAMHCLDLATGQERWTFQAGGAILHTAAIDRGKVIFGSHDGRVYALSASTGELLWTVQTGRGIIAAPLVVDGNVYIGSKDGRFYAIQGANGAVAWTYDAGEPIVTPAAYSATAGRVFFGTQFLQATALNIADGSLAWRRQLEGQSMQETCPQVSERHGVVIFRVLSSYDMWDNINSAGRELQNIGGADFQQEQDNASAYLQANPHRRTFFALKTSDGTDRYAKPVPVLWTWGVSATMNGQAIDDEHDRAWVTMRTNYQPTDDTVDTGLLRLGTGRFEDHVRWSTVDVWGLIMVGIPADEPRPLIATSDAWFTCQSYGPSGSYIPTGKSFTTCMVGGWMEFHDRHKDGNWAGMWPRAWIRGLTPPVWSHGLLLWNGHGGIGCKRLK